MKTTALASLLLAVLALLFSGCSQPAFEASPLPSAADAPTRTVTIRGWIITIPSDATNTVNEGPDFSVTYFDFPKIDAHFGIYEGHAPSSFAAEQKDTTQQKDKIGGQDVVWTLWTEKKVFKTVFKAETMMACGEEYGTTFHIFLSAPDAKTLGVLQDIVRTLTLKNADAPLAGLSEETKLSIVRFFSQANNYHSCVVDKADVSIDGDSYQVLENSEKTKAVVLLVGKPSADNESKVFHRSFFIRLAKGDWARVSSDDYETEGGVWTLERSLRVLELAEKQNLFSRVELKANGAETPPKKK